MNAGRRRLAAGVAQVAHRGEGEPRGARRRRRAERVPLWLHRVADLELVFEARDQLVGDRLLERAGRGGRGRGGRVRVHRARREILGPVAHGRSVAAPVEGDRVRAPYR